MKVRMTVTVEVDRDAWSDEYNCHPDEVREDVRRYFETQVFAAEAVEAAGLTVRIA